MSKEEVSNISKEVEKAMKVLATTKVSEDKYFEYLSLVEDVMRIYENYSKSIDLEDKENILEFGEQIIQRIFLESEEGILKS